MYRVDYDDQIAYISYLHTLAVTDCARVIRGTGTCLRELTISTERQKCNLRTLLSKGPLTDHDAAICIYDILAGVHHLHSRGLIHCDIKPENIFVSADGHAIVADFDHVQVCSTHTHNCAYPVPFRPPEVTWDGNCRKCAIGPAADMWALGVLLCDIRMDKNPFVLDRFDSNDCSIGLISAVFGFTHACAAERDECKMPPELAGLTRDKVISDFELDGGELDRLIPEMLRPEPAERITSYAALVIAHGVASKHIAVPDLPPDTVRRVPAKTAHTAALMAAFQVKRARGDAGDTPTPTNSAAEAVTRVIYYTRRVSEDDISPFTDEMAPLLAPDILAAAWNYQ